MPAASDGGGKELPLARSCGECQACCVVMRVGELGKVGWTPCPHLVAAGCGIYGAHPNACREFTCEWLLGWGGPDDRPDRLGLVLHRKGGEVRASEAHPGAADTEAARAARARWAAAGSVPRLFRVRARRGEEWGP